MRIKSLYIDDYKNIKKQTFDFSNNSGYIALIGLNGSGKSNLLEAISLIFGELYNIQNTKSVGKFWIRYSINEEDKFYGNIDENGNSIKLEKNPNLPSPVISCYSGEDQRLWTLIYKPYYTNFFNKAIKNGPYKPDMIYIDRHCWKIALISLLYSENNEVKDFIRQLNIDSSLVKIKFTHKNIGTIQPNDASNWYKRLSENLVDSYIGIDYIKNIDLNNTQYSTLTDDQLIFYYLYFLSIPEKNTKEGMRADKLIEDISLKLGEIDFVDLSEGEKKLILIECITKVLGDSNSLVLLDEPDAHTHIARKKDLLKAIQSFEGQILFTTHSPMFLNKHWEGYNDSNIFYMRDGEFEKSDPLKYLSELTDNNIDYFEGSFILSSKKILVVEGKYDEGYLNKAINIFAKSDKKYYKLKDIAIISANSAGAAELIYNQIFSKCIDKIEKIVFLFDYDDDGWKSGWKNIKKLHDTNSKIIPMFYQDNYSSSAYPTSDEDVRTANNSNNKDELKIKQEHSFLVEDLFSEESYQKVIKPVISAKKHKDFRQLPMGKNGTAGAIKHYIEQNYEKKDFCDKWFEGFKPVLDELLEVYYGQDSNNVSD
jgi:predicted ATP-dependent endonuclease of OLD family